MIVMKIYCIDFEKKTFRQFIVTAESFDEANKKALKMLDNNQVDWKDAPEAATEMTICEFQPKESRRYIIKKKGE